MSQLITQLEPSFWGFRRMSVDEIKQPVRIMRSGSFCGLLQELLELHASQVVGKPTLVAVESKKPTHMIPCTEKGCLGKVSDLLQNFAMCPFIGDHRIRLPW